MNYCINCGKELASYEKFCTNCGTRATEDRSAKKTGGALYFRYNELPDRVRQKLFSRQSANLNAQIKVKVRGIIPSYIWATILTLWIPFLFYLSNDSQWSVNTAFWLSLITIAISILFYRAVHFIVRWHKSVLKCNFYLTPLYFIKTYFDEIWCWGVWTIKDFKVTHNYTNGVYQNSTANIIFPYTSEQLIFSSEDAVQKFFNTINYFARQIADAYSNKNWQYFFENDDFYNVAAKRPIVAKKSINSTYYQYTWPTLAGIFISLGSYYINLKASHKYHEVVSRKNNSQQPTRLSAEEFKRRYGDLVPHFNEPEEPLPYNGMVKNYTYEDCTAPLEIVTKADMHYYVKIIDWYSGRLVQTIFIREGKTVKTKVPLGSYKIRYAMGKIWYGEIHRFGPSTIYSEANSRFDFQISDDRISGYTLELFLQRDGNLHTRQISADQF